MEQQLFFSSPIHRQGEYYDMDGSRSHGGGTVVVSDECESDVVDKMASSSSGFDASSSSRSPTCVVFAVDERLGDVFRVPPPADFAFHRAAAPENAYEEDVVIEDDRRDQDQAAVCL